MGHPGSAESDGRAGDQLHGRTVRAAIVHPGICAVWPGTCGVQQRAERARRGHRLAVDRGDHGGDGHARAAPRDRSADADHERAGGAPSALRARRIERLHCPHRGTRARPSGRSRRPRRGSGRPRRARSRSGSRTRRCLRTADVVCVSLPAVIMPTTWPSVLTSAPPESPGWMCAFVWIMPVSFSEVPFGSFAVIDRFRPVTAPFATVGRAAACPSALPIPATWSPTETEPESPGVMCRRSEAFCSWISATSCAGSTPTTAPCTKTRRGPAPGSSRRPSRRGCW